MEFDSNVPVVQDNAMVEIETSRAVQEVQAAMVVAKRFKRDQEEAYVRIMKSCERQSLATAAIYAYPRGGQMVTGPSIRLAETIAQSWGNLQFGIRELSQSNGSSEVEAFAWDIETNTRQTKVFKVVHERHTKNGVKKLTDPRDIYEMVANQGARRLRSCILGVIPGDIIDAAISKCDETLKRGSGKPLADRVRTMLTSFENLGISKEMIEQRLQHKTSAIVEQQLIELSKIFNSIKDGMSSREDWFNVKTISTNEKTEELTEKIKSSVEDKVKQDKEPKPKDHGLKSVRSMVANLKNEDPEIFDITLKNCQIRNKLNHLNPSGMTLEECQEVMDEFDALMNLKKVKG